MHPYTTTVEHLLPGMIVRAQDVEEGGTAVVRVLHTHMYEDGDARIAGDMMSVDVKRDTEVTVLHDPTCEQQPTSMNAAGLWDDSMAESLRRSAERVMAMHKNKGPQQYKTGGIKIDTPDTVTIWDQLGPAQPITMHGTPGMYLAPELTGYEHHLIVLTEHDRPGAFMYQCMPDVNVPEGLATAGPSLYR